MDIDRIVFEKGITVKRSEDGLWYFQSVNSHKAAGPVVPIEIGEKYNVRPIVVSKQHSLNNIRKYLLPIAGQQILELEHSDLANRELRDGSNFPHMHNIDYIVGAVIYHCKNLAEIYSEICCSHLQNRVIEMIQGDRINLSGQSEPYYEFDALITTCRRAYDTLRYILWKEFGGNSGSIPSSFIKVLSNCEKLPLNLRERLNASWSQFGEKLTEYRHCIQHYVPLDYGLCTGRFRCQEDGIWSIDFLIPDNPDVKSKEDFRYETQTDALSYGWALTNEICSIATAIINSIQNEEGSALAVGQM